jgi:hypothetical protein
MMTMSKPRFVYNQFDHGKKFISVATRAGAYTRQGSTDHCVITAPNGQKEPVPMKPLGKGLAYKIWKRFVEIGLIMAVIFAMYYLML